MILFEFREDVLTVLLLLRQKLYGNMHVVAIFCRFFQSQQLVQEFGAAWAIHLEFSLIPEQGNGFSMLFPN